MTKKQLIIDAPDESEEEPIPELYYGLTRRRAIEILWRRRATDITPVLEPDLSLDEVVESVATVWADFEIRAERREIPDIDGATSVATLLQNYQEVDGLLDEISHRVDEVKRKKRDASDEVIGEIKSSDSPSTHSGHHTDQIIGIA